MTTTVSLTTTHWTYQTLLLQHIDTVSRTTTFSRVTRVTISSTVAFEYTPTFVTTADPDRRRTATVTALAKRSAQPSPTFNLRPAPSLDSLGKVLKERGVSIQRRAIVTVTVTLFDYRTETQTGIRTRTSFTEFTAMSYLVEMSTSTSVSGDSTITLSSTTTWCVAGVTHTETVARPGSSSASSSSSSSSSSAPSVGTTVGAVLGSVVAVLLIVLLVYFNSRRSLGGKNETVEELGDQAQGL